MLRSVRGRVDCERPIDAHEEAYHCFSCRTDTCVKCALVPFPHRPKRSGWVTSNATHVPQTLPERLIPCLVARKVGKKEIDSVRAAYDAMTAKADKLAKKGVWNLAKVKEWSDVCNNLSKNEFAHVGNVFGISMEKSSELEKDNKGRYLLQR